MEKQVMYNSKMHFEHRLWKGELNYCQAELKLLNNKLSELITPWTAKELFTLIAHYQNEFIEQRNNIDDLINAIDQHEMQLAEQRKTGIDGLDTNMSKTHFEFRKKLEIQRYNYAELKRRFFDFLK